MSEFKLNAGMMKSEMSSLNSVKSELYFYKADLAVQIFRLRSSGNDSAIRTIKSKLGVESKKISNEITNINSIINTGNTICSKAKTAENAANLEMSGLSDIIRNIWPYLGGFPTNVISSSNFITALTISKFEMVGCVVGNAISIISNADENGFEGSLLGLNGKAGKHGKVFGKDYGYDAEGSILNIEGKGKIKENWDVEKGEVNAVVSGSVGFSALKGKASAHVGDMNVSAEGKLVNADAEGSIGVSLLQKGKLAPSLYAKAKAKASVAEGSVSSQFGSKEYNTHMKTEGTLLGAEAEASANVGRIVDEQGKVRWGASAKAGAEAYLAEGKVSGGFTFMGIKVDASIEGKAGGAGVKAGAEATTGGAEGEIGAGLGLGVGLKVKIDWTSFKAPKLKWPW